MENYVVLSLDLHLFFARIMKEHAFFLEAGFLPQNPMYIKKAEWLKEQFENFLCDVVKISNGIVSTDVLNSGEIVTEFTLQAERQTQRFTGISIDSEITRMEKRLTSGNRFCDNPELREKVRNLNQTAIWLLNEIISFKEKILCEVLSCKIFTVNYPLLIQHIIREAVLYRSYVVELESCGTINPENMRDVELFWNQIMMEHAMFIRGLLDPTEAMLIETADDFAKEYARLLEEARNMTDRTMRGLTEKTIAETEKYRDFKKAGAEGITGCEIHSIILPLLADHVLREANHYLRILNE